MLRSRAEHMGARIYLDYNASAPLKPQVRAAMVSALDLCGNPSSVHAAGRAARRVVEDAREAAAGLAGVPPGAIVFTAGGTEANVLALRGAGRPRVLVSAIEHDSVLTGVPEAVHIPVDAAGLVRL
ncbi:MAG: aminotransferase class V-fold PLP-dependent enzyme, partial [Alphaproteobacteria bacterium]